MFVAVAASALGTRTRAQTEAARREARTTAELYAFSRKIAGVIDLDDLLWIVVTHLARLMSAEIAILMPEKSPSETGKLVLRAAFPPDSDFSEADLAAARWSWDAERPTGRGTDTLPGGRWLFMPIRTSRSSIGVIGVLSTGEAGELASSARRLLEAVGNQTAVAIERVALAADIDQARLGAERERLRSAMLTSVSHDLRTPLASIIGALSSLRSYRDRYDDTTRDELLGTALSEAERLDRFVGNLLDMTRLDAGVIVPKRETVEVGDLISTTLRRAAPVLKDRVVASTVAPDLPTLSLDFVLAEQALFNILDNAAKYSASGGRIEVEGRRAGRAGSRSWCATRARASILPRSTGCSTSSIAPTTATAGGRARDWGSPSPRASSRSRAAPSLRAIAGIAAARNSWSATRHDRRRCRHPDRRGRAADPPPAAHDARRAGLSHDRGVDRRRGAVGAAPSPARPGAARSRPARHRRA